MAKPSMKLGRMIDETLSKWERESVLNMCNSFANGQVKSCDLVTFPTGIQRYVVILTGGFKLDCTPEGFKGQVQQYVPANFNIGSYTVSA